MAMSMLNGKEIFVTAGSTRAYIDAVRYLSNRSTGRLGSEIACECLRRGAYVTYFHGIGALTPFVLAHRGEVNLSDEALSRLDMIEIETIPQLVGSIERELKEGYYDAAIHAMAVLDFVPDLASVLPGKKKSDLEEWNLKLVRTPKVIDMIKRVSPQTTLVGFKLEVEISREQLIASATDLMKHSGAEIVVANDLTDIQKKAYKAVLIERAAEGHEALKTTEAAGRQETARVLCDRLEELLKAKHESTPED